ncbi:MAG: nucleotidyltransferase family protein [Erysipelotrichaceae bacterium]|nr:nucleotidyltransferase family protein [Erysipelotrichaceae bacterium]
MLAAGIVVEYNPFHNGHRYHIAKTRELTSCDVLVAVMSGNFVQRGEPAIVDKWQRTATALQNGVDLIIELPFIYCNQSAQQFAQGAVTLLNIAKVQHLVFGSESNNLAELQEIAGMSINVNNLRETLKTGIGYPKAYGLMAGEYYPNDILGIAYLKAMQKTAIIPHTIQRTNHYHDLTMKGGIASAGALREAIAQEKNIEEYSPMEIDRTHAHYLSAYYPYIRTLLLTLDSGYLQSLFHFNEGIENHLIKQAAAANDFGTFMTNCITRRYSRARIQRTLISLICQVHKKEVIDLPPLDTLRILGFNNIGRMYLKELKSQDVHIANRFNQIPKPYRKMEYRSSVVYHSLEGSFDQNLLNEIRGPLIMK